MRRVRIVSGLLWVLWMGTFISQGQLHVDVADATELETAIADVSVTSIRLMNDITVTSASNADNAFSNIDRALVIDGNNYTISRNSVSSFRFFNVTVDGQLTL